MHSKGVLVQVEHPSFGSAKGSGLLINNVVIAHGSILLPFCIINNNGEPKNAKDVYSSLLKELESSQYFYSSNRPRPRSAAKVGAHSFKFKIHHKVTSPLGIRHRIATSFGITQGIPRSEREENITEGATMCLIHHYDKCSGIMEEVSNWTLINRHDKTNDEASIFHVALPTFFFLMIGKPCQDLFVNTLQAVYKASKYTNLYPGTPVVIESTPFGNGSFTSSWSQGIISKAIGSESDGFLTDSRLIYGCEGAPVYIFKDGAKSSLMGLILHTLSTCNGEWVGFSLGISIKHLLRSLLERKSKVDFISDSHSPSQLDFVKRFNQINMDHLSSAVVFVRCAHKWGSGVVVDSSLGIILTCAHVVEHSPNSVKVVCKLGQFKASVLFSSPLHELYDLAVLSVGKIPGLKQLTFAESPPVLGETVFTAGYPLSTESLVDMNTTPTLSAGCISKVSCDGGPLQTTCCTQSGVSGGAVFRPPDQLLGIAVCNVSIDKTVLPSFGIAVSVEDFKTPVMQYLRTKDPSSLQSLHVESYKLKMDWELRDSKL